MKLVAEKLYYSLGLASNNIMEEDLGDFSMKNQLDSLVKYYK